MITTKYLVLETHTDEAPIIVGEFDTKDEAEHFAFSFLTPYLEVIEIENKRRIS